MLFGRHQRFGGALPGDGGLDDQDERDMKALDTMAKALLLPLAESA